MTYLPVDTAIKNYYASREIPGAQLSGLIERAQRALARHEHYRYHDGLSLLLYLRGLDLSSASVESRPAFEQSLAEAKNAVTLAPAQPMVWQRIARIHAWLGDAAEAVIRPLKMSIYAGRVEPTLLIGRLELGYRYLAAMDAEATVLLRDQTLLTWKLQPRELSRAIDEQRINWQGIRTVLAGSNDDVLRQVGVSVGRSVQ